MPKTSTLARPVKRHFAFEQSCEAETVGLSSGEERGLLMRRQECKAQYLAPAGG